MKNVIILCFIALVSLTSCDSNNLAVDTSNIDATLEFKHYEQDLFQIKNGNLKKQLNELSTKYPAFINGDYDSPQNIMSLNRYLNNDLNQQLFNDWAEKIGNYNTIHTSLNSAFKHYKYYYPNDSLPTIYTYISGLNYESPILLNDNNIIIGIDLFYGADYLAYPQMKIPQYLYKNYDKKYLTPVVLRKYATNKFAKTFTGETMLDNMIALGKIEYFIECMLPNTPDSIRFQFTSKQMQWCYGHDAAFWKHLTMKGLLFSKDYHAYKKYLQPGPFASSLERDSPARAGVYVGYQIVKAFMDRNPEVTLDSLMRNTDFTAIFKNSKYNP